jgi:MYXO-CTERM domain-containing protein
LQLPTSSTGRRGGYSYGFDLRLDPIRLGYVGALKRLSTEERDREGSQQTIDWPGKDVGNCKDFLSMPALLGGAAAAALGLSPSLGLVPAQLGKLAVGGALAALLGALAGPPACSADPEPRAAGRILLLAALALAGIDLLLDLPGAWLGPGVMSGLMLDPLEELAEALTASAALVALVRRLAPEKALMSHFGTNRSLVSAI